MVLVRQEREGQVELLAEAAVARGAIGADAPDVGTASDGQFATRPDLRAAS